MKKALLIAIALGSVSSAAAQSAKPVGSAVGECKLKLSQTPAIRGIRLGMTVDQALTLFPGSEKSEDIRARLAQPNFGGVSTVIYPSNFGSKEKFEGVHSVNLAFLDGELNFFSISYNGPHWGNDDQFATKVAEALSLPGVEFWKPALGGKAIVCDGFDVVVRLPMGNSGNTILMRNLEKDINKVISQREESKREEVPRAFKP
jgi:hypothetical protein